MFDELISALRNNADHYGFEAENGLVHLLTNAADAIEELQAEVQRLMDTLDMYGGEDGITQVFKEREELRKRVPRWVSTKERLPEAECGDFSKNVLVTDGKCIAISSYFNCEGMEPYWCYTGIGELTNWMPLPEPPQEETE